MDEGGFGASQVESAPGRAVKCDQEDRPYKCNQCDKSYRHAGSLVNHRKTHQVGLYTCLICQKEYSNPMGLKSHLRTHSEEKRFQCEQCGEAFRMSQQLYNHRKSLHSFCSVSNGENVGRSHKLEAQPPVIAESSNLMSNLENYIAESMVPVDFSQLVLKYYPQEKSQDEGTPEDNDDEVRATVAEETEEITHSNSAEYRYKCNQCEKAYKHAGSLANHRQSHMVGVYQCAVCFKEFSNLMAMKNHCRLHSDSRARRRFRSSAKVAGTCARSADLPQTDVLQSDDFREQHEDPPNLSEVSESSNVEEDADKIPLPDLEHQVEHESGSLSPLSKPNPNAEDTRFCLESLLQSSGIDNMVQVQENTVVLNSSSFKNEDEPGQCQAQQLSYDATLEEDANVEDSQNRPFKCQECGKTYRHAGSLINHKKTHQTGVYNCSLCSKQMFNMAALKNHLRAHFKSRGGRKLEDAFFHSASFSEFFQNSEDPYQCGSCGELLTNESDFVRHQALHQEQELKETCSEGPHTEEGPETDVCWREHPQASHGSSDDSAYSSGPGMPDIIKTEVESLAHKQWSPEESLAIPPEIKTESSGAGLQDTSTGFDQLPQDQIVSKEEESCRLQEPEQAEVDRPYKCESCGRTYRHKSSLINHKLTHKTGVYQCSLCPKQYTNLMALRNHHRFHNRSYAGRRGHTSRRSHHFFRSKPRFLQNKTTSSLVESVKLNDKISPGMTAHITASETMLRESQIHCSCGKSFTCSEDFHEHGQSCRKATSDSSADSATDLQGGISMFTNPAEAAAKIEELTEPHGKASEPSVRQGRRVYECDLCEKSYRHSGSLINHKRTHQTGDYMCPYCSKHVHNLAALKNHIRIHHKVKKSQNGHGNDNPGFLYTDLGFPHDGKDLFGCVTCEETFHSESDLVAHQMVHMALEGELWDQQDPVSSTPKVYKDPTLRDIRDYDWERSSVSEFRGEDSKDLGSPAENIKPIDYTCVECGEVYDSVEDLNNHKHTHQTGIYQCSFCPKEYPNLLALRSHFQSHTKPQALRNSGRETLDGSEGNEFVDNPPSVDNSYDCGHCGLIFSNEVDFHQHQVAHEKQVMDETLPGLQAEGQVSELSFPMHSSERELLRRIKSEMEEADHSEAADAGSLLSHICGFCGKTYDDLESLQLHSLSHRAEEVPSTSGNAPPEVDVQDESPQQSLVVKEEESSVETAKNGESLESRPYTCEQCGKTYRHGGSLVNHKKTHLVGNFQCVACSRQYPNLAAYRNHLRHHPDCKQQAAMNNPHELQASTLNNGIYPSGDRVQWNLSPPSSVILSDPAGLHLMSNDFKPNKDSESKSDSTVNLPPQVVCQTPIKPIKNSIRQSSRRVGRRKAVTVPTAASGGISAGGSLKVADGDDKSLKNCEFCGKMLLGVKERALHLSGNCERSSHSENTVASLVVGNNRIESRGDLRLSLSGLTQSPSQVESGFHQRPFRCEVCGRSYRHAGSLINHKQTHKTGVFRCSICQKRFFNLMAMKNHNRIHFELKRHKCLDCGKAFRLRKQLDTHQRIHRQRAAARKPGRRNRRSMKHKKVAQWHQQKSSIFSKDLPSQDPSAVQVNGVGEKCSNAKGKRAIDPNFRPYQCEECGKSYRHAGSLFNHKKSHKMGQYCCSICDKTYSNLMAMKNHQRTHSDAKRHHCSQCGKTFRWKRQLYRHQVVHVQEGPQSSDSHLSVEAIEVDHKEETSTLSRKRPRMTRYRPSSAAKKTNNLTGDQLSSLKPVCLACGILFTSYDELESHRCNENMSDMLASGKDGTEDPTSSEEGRPYQCNVCGRTYRHAGSLLNHKNTHETGLYKCSVCHKQFFNTMAIKNHLRTHTAEKRFQCADCGKAFRSSRELICHSRVHTGERPFRCPTCNRGFSSKLTLRHHQRTHKHLTSSPQSSTLVLPTDKEMDCNENNPVESPEVMQNHPDPTAQEDRKYKCNQCDRSYRHAGSLFNHQKTHRTGVYKCPNCLKEFFNLLAFKNHLRIHKYPCKDCGRAFRIASHLAAHRKLHEQEGPLTCPICNKHFSCRSTFDQHQLTHNGPSGDVLEPQAVANFMVEVT